MKHRSAILPLLRWLPSCLPGLLASAGLLAAVLVSSAASASNPPRTILRSPRESANPPSSIRSSVPPQPPDSSTPAEPQPRPSGGRGAVLRKFPPHQVKFDARQATLAAFTNVMPAGVSNAIPPELLQAPTEPFVIGPGDVLEIELMGQPGRTTTMVCPDGRIYYDLLDGLDVWGLDLKQARELLEKGMSAYQQVPKPRLSITVRTVASKRIWILGRVVAPGVYPLATPVTLLEAISMAGGPVSSGDNDLASLEDSFVMRQGQIIPVDFKKLLRGGDMTQNIYLRSDDFVYLPSSFEQQVHVFGLVGQTGPVPFKEQMTLVSAISAAGGHRGGAHLSQVAIVRGTLNDPKVAIVDLGDIERGKAPDVLLEPRDIIYVPSSPYTFIFSFAKTIITSFVRTVAVNEGVRAVVRTTTAVAPTIQQQ